ncbi:hypothetical protein J3R30DRAFT_906090 [Lentinula aciculospora]|uniref:Uncharacterized protein n=1 Tax=Lentinula aciculospora TaxID=153920 RepID=A0A9W9AQY2_9AGAR|nr:hypothetical protein J3R30DRAFT_906090 [Lentinula aciculospora]
MDLDADLYGDLYETDVAGPAADEKSFESPKQASNTEVPSLEPVERSSAAPAPSDSAGTTITASVSQPSAPTSFVQPVQQIPTYEDPMIYRDTYSGMQGSYEQNFSTLEHRSVRPSEMKDDGRVLSLSSLLWHSSCPSLPHTNNSLFTPSCTFLLMRTRPLCSHIS